MKLPSFRNISRTVFILGLVSLFTDISSEMIYPLLPLFLSQVLGAGALSLGIIEGVAESTASLLKFASGFWADRVQRRKPFIVAGYGLAGVARPLIGLAQVWPTVLLLRFSDRVGKGIRSAPRDAMITETTPAHLRGTAFGFHQAMDHAGAVVGPLIASLLLLWVSLRVTFLLAAVPALIAFLLVVFYLKEKRAETESKPGSKPWPFQSGRALGAKLSVLLGAIFLFTLGNSTDAFLLIRLSDAGLSVKGIALLWSAQHIVRMLANYYGGRISDRIGAKPMILIGWTVYALVYLGFAMFTSLEASILLFMIYGLYFGFTEPSEKALVSLFAPKDLRATAFGYYALMIGIGALPASLLFGWVWQRFSAAHAFQLGAAFALAAALLLAFVRVPKAGVQV